jgi:hypothetical protein
MPCPRRSQKVTASEEAGSQAAFSQWLDARLNPLFVTHWLLHQW